MNAAIEDYGLIGDCESAALVARNGSIDWLCWPRFDSDACFAALLGTPENGRWLLAPASIVKNTNRKYRDHTLILETRFETVDGAVTVIDFMPPRPVTQIWSASCAEKADRSAWQWNSRSGLTTGSPCPGSVLSGTVSFTLSSVRTSSW